MNILLVNPPFANYGGVVGHGGKAAPLNLAYIASYIMQQRPKNTVNILDCEGESLNYETIEKNISKYKPHIVGITSPTPAYEQVLKICRIVKSIDQKTNVILGGPHPTSLPEETLSHDDVDFVVIGEGELTVIELLDSIESGSKDYSNIDGIAYRGENSNVVFTKERKFIEDLDILPFPARQLLPIEAYYLPPTKKVGSGKATNMITGRGCPYNCGFCLSECTWKREYRSRSIENVVAEIEECITKYGLNEFSFHDELFTGNKKRLLALCEEIIKHDLKISWVCQSRVDHVDKEILDMIKKSGCKKISYGFESGSQIILNKMNKRANLDQARIAVKITKEAGLKIVGGFMLGYIGETVETIKETIAFAKELDLDTAAFFIAIPYPGTDFYNEAKTLGFLRADIKWNDYAIVSKQRPPMELPNLTSKELDRWKKQAYKDFYLRPRYLLKILSSVRSVSDVKNLILGLKIFLQIT
ncbi:MAG: B12-binding domain-containing radical SAM protein [Elusimicrobia bacterium]|nr:B12-binding domain-containing radical SAM protein [Candidatus Liberimonas magnetica]